ncbi:MAG: hypothetical protein HC899_38470 [Leptolyngbyaceae cyanobacterium SM1_4_3]|nr:hypothetical protein [Leptolyngbyaceae cyanobacterium SM1_4_3]
MSPLESIQSSEERYSLAFKATNDGIWDWNLATNEIYFSPEWHALITDPSQAGIDLNTWLERIHPEDLPWVERDLTAHLNGLSFRLKANIDTCIKKDSIVGY